MRFALAITSLLLVAAAKNDDDRPTGVRGAGGLERLSDKHAQSKSKDPDDPRAKGPRPAILAPPSEDEDVAPLELTLGKAKGKYNGEVYADTKDSHAAGAGATPGPDPVAQIWDEVEEIGPPKIPSIKESDTGNAGGAANFEIEDGKIRCIVEYKRKKKGTLLKALRSDARYGLMSGKNGDKGTHYEFDDVNTVVVSIKSDALETLLKDPNVVGIYPDTRVGLIDGNRKANLFTRHGRHLAQTTPYGVEMLDVKWLKKRGEGAEVCVIDTGYTPDHEDLPSDFDWIGDGVDQSNPPVDDNGHGTHVTGTIAALDNNDGVVGVAPGVRVAVVPSIPQFLSATVANIRECRDSGAKVVNMSFGRSALSECRGGDFHDEWGEARMREFAIDDGMLLVAAAGNHGDCPTDFDALNYPASYPDVLSVASVDSDGVRAAHSARNNQVDISAPGVGVRSTTNDGGYQEWSGTSMAAPHVAGVAALVWSIMPWLTSVQLRTFLIDAAQDEHQEFTGAGLVNPGFYSIVLQRSGKCLDNWAGWPKLWTCGVGYSDQMFTYDYFNRMIVGSDGKCLRLSGNHNGASLTFSACDKNDDSQRFTYHYATKELKSAGGYCLDNHGAYQFQNYGIVHMWTCHGGSNQKWLLGKDYETRLYQDSNMNAGGRMYRTPGAGRWSSMPTTIKTDRLTRVIIPRGFAFEYFQHSAFGGWQGIFGSHDFGINLYMGSHNDSVSSFKVRKLPDGKVRLCRHSDCSSYSYDCTWMQNYASMPWEIGNDQLSRVFIPRGYQFQYFAHTNFGGWSGTFGSCDYAINLNMGGHNDAVSSFKIKILDC